MGTGGVNAKQVNPVDVYGAPDLGVMYIIGVRSKNE